MDRTETGDEREPTTLEALQARVRELEAVVAAQDDRLAGLVRIAANLGNTRNPQRAMRQMVSEISTLLRADRTTIYELRKDENMLRGLAMQDQSIVVGVPVGEGIAGKVAERKRPINLKDAYRHPDFDPKYDKLTGYRTRSMLVVPMQNPSRQVIGVVQVLNKRDGYFSVEDETLLTALASQAAITLEALQLQLELNVSNAELRHTGRQLQQKVRELELLYDNERAIAEAADVDTLCDTVLRVAARVAKCQAAAIYLPDDTGYGPTYIRAPEGQEDQLETICHLGVGEGVLGKTAGRGEGYVLREGDFEAQDIPRVLGGTCGVKVDDAVTAPILDGEKVIGAFALVNRRPGPHRDDQTDQRLAVLIAGQVSRAVVRLAERRDAQLRDRLMTIGQMLSGVLHDLKGPMTIISGYSQLMASVEDAGEREQMAASIRRQVEQFNDMTREVMAFARGERKVFARKVYLDKFVRSVTEALAPEFDDRGVALVVDNKAKRTAWFDEAKMVRVVTNIARNARQALGDHGTFTWLIEDTDDGGTRFVLKDDGPGIPEAIRPRLFEAFTTAGKPGGTGLGLAIVRRIVEDHGGCVGFDTRTGGGTTFTVHLPGPSATEMEVSA
ncbi:MAG: GAF domain-containing sensor histidine kinase [Myxococcales bacterium]|nr:GAF domain-containing sensor histidine kinase [Myxococcales bacterium]